MVLNQEDFDNLTQRIQRIERWIIIHAPLIPRQSLGPQEGMDALTFWLLRDADEDERAIYMEGRDHA